MRFYTVMSTQTLVQCRMAGWTWKSLSWWRILVASSWSWNMWALRLLRLSIYFQGLFASWGTTPFVRCEKDFWGLERSIPSVDEEYASQVCKQAPNFLAMMIWCKWLVSTWRHWRAEAIEGLWINGALLGLQSVQSLNKPLCNTFSHYTITPVSVTWPHTCHSGCGLECVEREWRTWTSIESQRSCGHNGKGNDEIHNQAWIFI